MQPHRYAEIIWIIFYKACNPLQQARLPRNQIIGENTRTAWICWIIFVLVNISSGEKKHVDERYWASEYLVKKLVVRAAAEEMLKMMKNDEKVF